MHDSSDKLVCCATSERVPIHNYQKDGSEFSDVTFASDDDNDISDLNECDQEVDKTPIEDYGPLGCSTTNQLSRSPSG